MSKTRIYRMPVNEEWASIWFASDPSSYGENILRDIKLRDAIRRCCKKYLVIESVINRTKDNTRVLLYCARENLAKEERNKIEKELINTEKNIKLSIHTIKTPETDPKVIAGIIAENISSGISFRRSFQKFLIFLKRKSISGLKIYYKGRLGGASIARQEVVRFGKMPVNTISSNIKYSAKTIVSKFGCTCIKVWVCK